MRILILSDLHLECGPFEPPVSDADAIVLAGDIGVGMQGFNWAKDRFAPERCIYLAGNHEFYNREVNGMLRGYRQEARPRGMKFLENATATIGGVRFLGTTLWTDFRLDGDAAQAEAMWRASRDIRDFLWISLEDKNSRRILAPADVLRRHEAAREFLQSELAKPFDGKTVVVTHFAPSPQSIASIFAGDPLNPYFASNLEELIETHQPALWVHGHTHGSCDYRIGTTRIVCNPRGYHPHALNPNFDPSLVIEL